MKNIQWICYKKGSEPFQNTDMTNNIQESINIMSMSESPFIMPMAESESMYVPKIEMPIMIANNSDNTEGFQDDSVNIMAESSMMSVPSNMMPMAESESMYVPKIEMPIMIANNPDDANNTESFKNIYKCKTNSSRFSSNDSRSRAKPIYIMLSKKK